MVRSSTICASGCYMPHLCSGTPAACLMKPKSYYPLFADLNGRDCVIIGGGLVAQRKVTTLLGYGAKLTVISPTITRRLAGYSRQGRIRHLARRFRPSDLRRAWLVYAATDNHTINGRVYRTAAARRIFTNVVDQTPLCSFIAPALVRRGPLTIAVSTGGVSPSLAKRLRTEIGEAIGSEYVPMLRLLAQLRGVAKRTLPRYNDRKRYFDHLVHGRIFELVRSGRPQTARHEAIVLLKRYAMKNGN